ncbi:MAG: phage terminase large subunit, partial [Pseudomonadota bacterium]
MFKPDQLQWLETLPLEPIEFWRGWDLASTVGGDYTVGAKIGKAQDGRFIIADIVRIRAGTHERDAAILNTAAMDGRSVKISIPRDPGAAGVSQCLYLTKQLAGYSVVNTPESGDKITRASPFSAQVNVGNVAILRGAWNRDLLNEMANFPNSTHDDQIDAMSRSFSHLIEKSRVVISNDT